MIESKSSGGAEKLETESTNHVLEDVETECLLT